MINDSTSENSGTITITLKDDSADPDTYKVASSPNDSATLTIYDDDLLPKISLLADNGIATENTGFATFTLTTLILQQIQQY